MENKIIFLASSSELKEDRDAFQIFINNENKRWVKKGAFIQVELWEDFLDAMSATRLQDEYNKAIQQSDIFVMLFFTKVGKYTEEEFDNAFKRFKETSRPFIFTYFKDAPAPAGANENDLANLKKFQQKLSDLGHYYTRYTGTSDLLLKFSNQLDKLADNGFIKFENTDAGPKKRWPLFIISVLVTLAAVFAFFKWSGTNKFTGVTVFVHGKMGRQDILLRQGNVLMDIKGNGELKANRITKSINDNGEAIFQNVPVGAAVSLQIDFSEPYKSTHPDSVYTIGKDGSIYLEVALQGADKVWGTVYNDNNEALQGVSVKVDSLSAVTDAQGYYIIPVPEKMQSKKYTVWFTKEGFETEAATAYPQTGKRLDFYMNRKKTK